MSFLSKLFGGAASTAFSGGINGLWGSFFGGNAMERQSRLNEQAAQRDFDRQMQFYQRQWSDQTQYNDPSAVKARYQAAGINPTAAFGTAGSYSPAQTPSGSVNASKGASSAFPTIRTDPYMLAQMDIMKAQADNIRADTAKKQGDTLNPTETQRGQQLTNNLLENRVVGQDLANRLNDFDLQFKSDTRSANISKLEQSVVNMTKQADLMNAQLQVEMDKHRNNPTVVEELKSRIYVNNLQAALLSAQADLSRKGIEVADTEIWKKLNETANIRDLNALIQEQIRTEGSAADLKRAEASLKEFESDAVTGKGTWSGRDGALLQRRIALAVRGLFGGY